MLNEIFQIDRFIDTPVRQLSLGQRMRGDLVAAMLHSPDVLFLDEPTIGLDVEAKYSVQKFIKEVNQRSQTTIILTTHDLGDIQELCRRVIIISEGKIIEDGSMDELIDKIAPYRHLIIDFYHPATIPHPHAELVSVSEARAVYRFRNYLLPFSHDEVVHGKATILQKMNGQYEQKFPQARAMYLYMMVHPGKKLNFMGNEIGQLREWDEMREQDWDMRRYPNHDSFYHCITELNRLYLTHPALSEWDYQEKGFQWLDCHQEDRCIYVIERRSKGERIVAIFNFSQRIQADYTVTLSGVADIVPLLYSDWEPFGGTTPLTKTVCRLQGNLLVCTLQPFSAMLLHVGEETEEVRPIEQ